MPPPPCYTLHFVHFVHFVPCVHFCALCNTLQKRGETVLLSLSIFKGGKLAKWMKRWVPESQWASLGDE